MNQPIPQNPQEAAAFIERMASQQLGGPAAAGPAGPAAAAAAAPAAPGPAAAKLAPETSEGKAVAAGAPATEADAMSAEAVVYDIPVGNGTRKMTPQQIAATLERYAGLNHRHATLKPAIDVVQNLLDSNPGMTAEQLARNMIAIAKAQASNPTMGGQAQQGAAPQGAQRPQPSPAQPGAPDPFAKWEEENAAALPPGYRDMATNMQSMMQTIMQQNQLLQRLVGGATGSVDAAQAAFQGARQEKSVAIQRSIGNNLDRAQAALQLPDESANDFMVFATERGYTFEDFVDPDLTFKVMTDFRNVLASPEMERLRTMAQRRQAFTGSLGTTPAASAAAAAAQQGEGDATFNRLVEGVMAKRRP